MTVEELITMLRCIDDPKSVRVMVDGYEGDYDEAHFVGGRDFAETGLGGYCGKYRHLDSDYERGWARDENKPAFRAITLSRNALG